jgi:DNA-binding GntR family transcriptional regulator
LYARNHVETVVVRCTRIGGGTGTAALKSNTVFKKAFNEILDLMLRIPPGSPVDPETKLAERVGVSRTTVRKTLHELVGRRILKRKDGKLVIGRKPDERDYFPMAETIAASDRVESKLMEWISRDGRRPGEYVNGLDLARRFGVSTGAVRECLRRFEQFGLVEKRPNSGWIFRGFTADFALELFEVRELFEISCAEAFAAQPPDAPAWGQLRAMETEHRRFLRSINRRYRDFSALDERFHRLIYTASRNRFMEGFYDLISLIFHYHYQWRKSTERQRNEVATREHLDYIEALFSHDSARVQTACRLHLASARATLLASIE